MHLDPSNREICAVVWQVLKRIRYQDQQTAMLINRWLGVSAVLSQKNRAVLLRFSAW